jgi:phage head maturation protease
MTEDIEMKLFGTFTKTEAQDDGTIKVWGYASSGEKDSDGETILPDAMKAAIGDYMKFGAVREMHQPLAAGTAIEIDVQEDGRTWFGAHVVDPIAVKKVQTEVYKGFSIGGKVLKRNDLNKTIIEEIKLTEVSLVDRPANPEAVFTMYKADNIEKPEDQGTLKKGMYSVSNFASMLQSIAYLIQETEWEADYEGDSSPIPAQLRSWLTTGAGIFEAMAKEEIAELVTALGATVAEKSAVADDLKKAEGTTEPEPKPEVVEKAGSRYSKATKSVLANIHKAIKEAAEHMDTLKYEDAEEAEDEEETEKSDDEADDDSDKKDDDSTEKSDAVDDLTKTETNEDLNKALKDNELLKAELDELKKKAAPPKGSVTAVPTVVEKADETVTKSSDNVEKVEEVPEEGTEERALYEIKKAHKSGGIRLG